MLTRTGPTRTRTRTRINITAIDTTTFSDGITALLGATYIPTTCAEELLLCRCTRLVSNLIPLRYACSVWETHVAGWSWEQEMQLRYWQLPRSVPCGTFTSITTRNDCTSTQLHLSAQLACRRRTWLWSKGSIVGGRSSEVTDTRELCRRPTQCPGQAAGRAGW